MRLAAFFHCWAAGNWRPSTFEFVDALEESEFPGPLYVGLVGSPEQRAEAIAAIRERWPAAEVCAESDPGPGDVGPNPKREVAEPVTLRTIRPYAMSHDGAVMYGHTKGASHHLRGYPAGDTAAWRRRLIECMVRGWRRWVAAFESGDADLAGFYWELRTRNFCGNFWAATCEHCRRLPETVNGDGESWIGESSPRPVIPFQRLVGVAQGAPVALGLADLPNYRATALVNLAYQFDLGDVLLENLWLLSSRPLEDL